MARYPFGNLHDGLPDRGEGEGIMEIVVLADLEAHPAGGAVIRVDRMGVIREGQAYDGPVFIPTYN